MDACEVAKLAAHNLRDANNNISNNSNNESNNNCANISLAVFGLHTKILLKDNLRKSNRRWAVDD